MSDGEWVMEDRDDVFVDAIKSSQMSGNTFARLRSTDPQRAKPPPDVLQTTGDTKFVIWTLATEAEFLTWWLDDTPWGQDTKKKVDKHNEPQWGSRVRKVEI